MATRKLPKDNSLEDTKGAASEVDDEEDDDDGDDRRPAAVKATQAKAVTARTRRQPERAPVIRLARQVHDPAEDWEVEHSGTDDEKGGPPKYDESPIKGGLIVASTHLHCSEGEMVNANGHEIDPDDMDYNDFPKVIGGVGDNKRYERVNDSVLPSTEKRG